jgi:hypothetical protein
MLILGSFCKNTNYSECSVFLMVFLYKNLKNEGKTKRSRGIATINPPITAMARGCCIWAPIPIPRARGESARMAPIAVISFGRILKEIA